ncbi:MAG TPA: TonB-dependent receptor [Candidatus Baltobacteraceae bacterium]|nr:TonB-dependent receptor [Candidatus Baltobacteraceae bacterium]
MIPAAPACPALHLSAPAAARVRTVAASAPDPSQDAPPDEARVVVVVASDPGTSASDALVDARAAGSATHVTVRAARDGRAVLRLPRGRYTVTVTKPGFAPAHAQLVVGPSTHVVRIALHASPASALRTIGEVAAAERGAFNTTPVEETTVPREAYRDMSQPGLADVLTEKPGIIADRASRGIGFDAPPVALVRGGTPMETQVLLEGVPVTPATTRAFPLTAIPSFVTQELEVSPGASALVPTIDGAMNGTLNLRFAEPTPVWRALPEQGFDSRGGSFTDVTGGGASGALAFAVAGTANGEPGDLTFTNAIQHALAVKARSPLSPASGLTVTAYDEADEDFFSDQHFAFTGAEYRIDGAQAGLLARVWHVDAAREGTAAGDPLEFATTDSLSGGSLELDRTAGKAFVSAGFTATHDDGAASGVVDVPNGSYQNVDTAFLRAIVAASPRWQLQAAAYDVAAHTVAGSRWLGESGIGLRGGVSYRATDALTLRASTGVGFTPPSLVALAGLRGALGGPEASSTTDVGLQAHVIDPHTTLSADYFTTNGDHRLVETLAPDPWTSEGPFTRHGVELSLARFVPAGFGYLLQAWTANDSSNLDLTAGDVAAASTQGYAEASYHWANGSRFSVGATYYAADPAIGQTSAVLLNSNLEIQIGRRGKIQFDVENLNDARLAVPSPLLPLPIVRNAWAPAPRTFRMVLRRSIGRTTTDNG